MTSKPTLSDAWRIGNRIGELRRQRDTFEQRGRGEWTADDQAELDRLVREQHESMAAVAREDIAPHLDRYRRPTCPARPPRVEREIPVDEDGSEVVPGQTAARVLTGDAAVEHRLARIAKKERKSPTDKRVLKLWADHRRAVQKAEAEGSSRAKALLTYLGHAEAAGDQRTADALRGFLEREWGHRGAVPADIDAAAVALARRRDVISDRLMYGDKPKSETRGAGPMQICAPEVM